jgi:hypothetical protein
LVKFASNFSVQAVLSDRTMLMSPRTLRFEAFTLDLERLCLRGPSGQIDLRRKSFEVVR